MFTEIYIEAILVDAQAADVIWERWNRGLMTDQIAAIAWVTVAFGERDREAQVCESKFMH